MRKQTKPKYQVAACAMCAEAGRYTECSTHPDAANPLAPCQGCGAVTCLDHRIEDAADRCNRCAAIHYAEADRGAAVLAHLRGCADCQAARPCEPFAAFGFADDARAASLAFDRALNPGFYDTEAAPANDPNLGIVRVPRTFVQDHMDRGLPTPTITHADRFYFWIDRNDPEFAELVSDAEFYGADKSGGTDYAAMNAAARRFLRAIERNRI